MSSGVPQGSVLEPTLVLIFINDNPCYIFADVNADGKLEGDIEAVEVWSRKWNHPLNLTKCLRMTSAGEHRGNEMRDIMISQAKDPDVTNTSNFEPSEQCASAANKAF